MKKSLIVFLLCFSSALFAQRGKLDQMNAERLYQYCKTYQNAFLIDGGSDTYKDRKELVEATRAFNYVEAVMDESNGAHWDISIGVEELKVREWHWEIGTSDMISQFVLWLDKHPENRLDPANIAIKEAGVAIGAYVYDK